MFRTEAVVVRESMRTLVDGNDNSAREGSPPELFILSLPS